jgi:hypothetical protein
MGKVRVEEFTVSPVAVGCKSMLAAWQASPVPTRPGHPEEAVEIVVGPTGSSLASGRGACELGKNLYLLRTFGRVFHREGVVFLPGSPAWATQVRVVQLC